MTGPATSQGSRLPAGGFQPVAEGAEHQALKSMKHLSLSRRDELARAGCRGPFEAAGNSDTDVVVILEQIISVTIATQPEVLHGMSVRRVAALDRTLGEAKQLALAMIKRGGAAGIGAL
jgi:hypothetical protein